MREPDRPRTHPGVPVDASDVSLRVRHLAPGAPAPACDADDVAVTLSTPHPPRLAPGEYAGILLHARRETSFQRPRIECVFELLIDPVGGDLPEGTRLSCWFALGPRGQVARSSKFARMWLRLMGRAPRRGERMSPAILRDRVLRLRVCDVLKDHHQRVLTPVERYSKVEDVLGYETGGPEARP